MVIYNKDCYGDFYYHCLDFCLGCDIFDECKSISINPHEKENIKTGDMIYKNKNEIYHYTKIMNNTTQDKIEIVTRNLKDFLIHKNKNYGDSALNPINIFSKLSNGNQIDNRIDDKLSRIKNII